MQNDGHVNPFDDVRKKVRALKDRLREDNRKPADVRDDKTQDEENALRESSE